MESIRSINGSGKVEAEIRYFLSSYTDAPEMLAKAIRQHWSIENSLHWVLDVTFREDDCRVRDRTTTTCARYSQAFFMRNPCKTSPSSWRTSF